MNNKAVILAIFLLINTGTTIGMGYNSTIEEVKVNENLDDYENAVEISDWYDLHEVKNGLDGNYILMNDLDEGSEGYDELVDYWTGWNPIGEDFANSFKGVFDGNGYEIRDLFINRTITDRVGLFGRINQEGKIFNLGIKDADVTGDTRVGMLAGENSGTIKNTFAIGEVNGESHVGGLVGLNNIGKIENSYAIGNVSADDRIGGLLGFAYGGSVENSYYHEDMPECHHHREGSWPLNDDEFNSISTFESAGWNIQMVETERDYPFLSNKSNEENPIWLIKESHVSYDLTITIDGIGTTYPLEGTHSYYENGKICLEAIPEEEHYFLRWTGDVESKDNYTSVTMDEDKSITAHFKNIPYEIRNWEELYLVRLDLEGNYTLMDDLNKDTDGYNEYVDTNDGWKPIGYDRDPFTGRFDGNGHIISDLYINRPDEDYVGLFGEVHNSNLTDLLIKNAEVKGDQHVGGIVGYNRESSVTDSSAEIYVSGSGFVGGLIGRLKEGVVSESNMTGNVNGFGLVGGLIGENNEGFISKSHSKATVNGDNSIGGLVGENYFGVISESYSNGDVYGKDWVGGLVGLNYKAVIIDSYTNSDVIGDNSRIGGIVGRNSEGSVLRSYSTGNITGKDFVGGFAGENFEGTIDNSFTTGNVIRDSGVGTNFGGFVGRNTAKVTNSYSTARVIYEGENNPTDKGFAGSSTENEEMSGNYWNTETSGQSETAGKASGRTTNEMTWEYEDTYLEWNFQEIWRDGYHEIVKDKEGNTGYPALQWQRYIERPFFDIEVIDYESTIKEGEEVTVKYYVENTGGVEGTRDILLTVNDDLEKIIFNELILDVEESYSGEFTWQTRQTGEFKLEVHTEYDREKDEFMLNIEEDDDHTFLSAYWWLIIPILMAAVVVIGLKLRENRKSS